ncbi:MAG: radical SAM family heme chaperone HemW [Oscillospiraceae bacterium]|jgi:oxygen-independent coproporphyrinogen-3 oxidase|nr:radical SAM family heme chaperone HemW [Oscillospiraceae bacterium]
MTLFRTTAAEEKALGVYVHIPFCKSKCEYCDFYSIGGSRDRRTTDSYLQALADHIKETGRLAPGYRVDSVYFGGGTPSFFGAENLEKILDEIQKHFTLSPEAEISLEANPDSVSPSALKRLIRAGFNRLSLGVQSDDNEMLKKLGRPHSFEQAQQAVHLARQAGFANISLDLMFGLPNQTLTAWKDTLAHVLELKPEHISCYALKVEENTPLWGYKDCANLPDDDLQADMYLAASDALAQRGYTQYEISNFARKGFEAKHNLKYWTGGEYIGFGPTAASDFAGKRFTAVSDLQGYIRGIAQRGEILRECEAIPARERAGEYVMLRLRLAQGLRAEEYERSFLMPFKPLERLLLRFQEQGLADREDDRWWLTPRGWLVSNQIILALHEAQAKSTPLAKRK